MFLFLLLCEDVMKVVTDEEQKGSILVQTIELESHLGCDTRCCLASGILLSGQNIST